MLKGLVESILDKAGFELHRKSDQSLTRVIPGFSQLYARCSAYTMTSPERLYALYRATEYVVTHAIPGALVECGVWKGGSAMMMALTLLRLGQASRELYLYDTYEGMTAPTQKDVNHKGYAAATELAGQPRGGGGRNDIWCYAPLDGVQHAMDSTGYPGDRIRWIKGKVEETIPDIAPDQIAVLRLDTDWYESTYHELVHLFPRLSRHGVLILDDYGYWRGAREATDRYFQECGTKILLNRIDDTGYIAIKTE